jgi:hypothetical protein
MKLDDVLVRLAVGHRAAVAVAALRDILQRLALRVVVADAGDEQRAGRVELAGVERLARLGAERAQLQPREDVAARLADLRGDLVDGVALAIRVLALEQRS